MKGLDRLIRVEGFEHVFLRSELSNALYEKIRDKTNKFFDTIKYLAFPGAWAS